MEIYEIAEAFYKQLVAVIEAGYNPAELGSGTVHMGVYEDYRTGELASVSVTHRHYKIGKVLLESLMQQNNDINLKQWKIV